MKVLIVLAAIAFAATAIPNEFDEEAAPEMDLFSQDTVFLAAKATVGQMLAKGATEADCKDLAKTSCKEVESEVSTDQKTLDKLQTGKHCDTLGDVAVTKTTTEYTRTVTKHKEAKIQVTKAHNARVTFGTRTFNTLKVGSCGTFFGSRSYLTAKATYESKVRIEVSWKGRVVESLKAKTMAIAAKKRAVHKCRCAAKKSRDTLWTIVSSTKRRSRQVKAHAKCKMMSCVLNGTPLSSGTCKSSLTTLRKKVLTRETEAVTGCASGAKVSKVSGLPCNSKAGPICHGYNLKCYKTSLSKCKVDCKARSDCHLAEYDGKTCCLSKIATKKACPGNWARAHGWTGYTICR